MLKSEDNIGAIMNTKTLFNTKDNDVMDQDERNSEDRCTTTSISTKSVQDTAIIKNLEWDSYISTVPARQDTFLSYQNEAVGFAGLRANTSAQRIKIPNDISNNDVTNCMKFGSNEKNAVSLQGDHNERTAKTFQCSIYENNGNVNENNVNEDTRINEISNTNPQQFMAVKIDKNIRNSVISSTDDQRLQEHLATARTVNNYGATSKTSSMDSFAPVDFVENGFRVTKESKVTPQEENRAYSASRRSSTDPEKVLDLDLSTESNEYRDAGEVLIINTNENNACKQNEELRNGSIIKYCDYIAKVIYVVLLLARLPTLLIYLGYDVKCAINEETTFANCTQEFLVPDPKSWVLYSKAISSMSSITLLFILWCNREKLNYHFYRPLKRLKTKASFWMTNILFALTFVYYIIRIDGSDLKFSIALLSWWPSTLLVVYSLNYLRPVDLPDLWFTIGYCSTIFIYLAETFCVVVAVSPAVHKNIIPLVNRRNVDYKIKAFAFLVVTVRAVFTSRLFYFFWYKIFHGGKYFFES